MRKIVNIGSYWLAIVLLTQVVIAALPLQATFALERGGRDMAIVPKTNVNLATNVRDVLNSAGGSVGNDLQSFFTANANINKWSKYKPVVHKKDFALTDEEFALAGYGFDIQGIYGYSYDTLFAAKTSWDYILPKGGVNEPLRLGDFAGYNTDSVSPVKTYVLPENINYTTQGYMTITAYLVWNAGFEISFRKIGVALGMESENSLEYAVIYKRLQNGAVGIVYGDGYDFGDEEDEMRFQFQNLSLGTYLCRFVAVERDIYGNLQNGFVLPNGEFQFTIMEPINQAYVVELSIPPVRLRPTFSNSWGQALISGMYPIEDIAIYEELGRSIPHATIRLGLNIRCYDQVGTYLGEYNIEDIDNAEVYYNNNGATQEFYLDEAFFTGSAFSLNDFESENYITVASIYRVIIRIVSYNKTNNYTTYVLNGNSYEYNIVTTG